MARNERNSKVICFLVCFIAIAIISCVVLYKPPLNNITIEELDKVYGIKVGGVIIERVQLFLADNPGAKVEDLRQIKGVDNMIIDQLKGRFR